MKYIHIYILLAILSSCSDNKLEQEREVFIEVNENKIHTKIKGSGQPIILAHGGYLNLDMWNPQMEELSKTNKVIRFSDLGHGKSQKSGSQTYGHEIIQQIITENEEQKSVLIGLSWGAMICVDYALNHPENVDKLILVSPGLNGWEYFKDSIANNNYQQRKKATEHSDTILAAKLFHKNWVIGPRRKREALTTEFLTSSLKMIEQTMSTHWREDWSELDENKAITRLNEIQIPTYIIIGREDAEDILLIADEYEKHIPNSKKIVIEDAAHLINMEHPEKFNAIIRTILNE